mgnify:CR=1 FL=1
MSLIKNKFTLLNQSYLKSLSKKELSKTFLIKNMTVGKKNAAGKNSSGKITVRHKGGGHKKRYRNIDFIRNKDSIGIVVSLEYDPYRTAFIASVFMIPFCKGITISPLSLSPP